MSASCENESCGSQINVGANERRFSIAIGCGALVLAAKQPRLAVPLLLGGGALIWRGASGHCSVYHALGVDTSERDQVDRNESDVEVQAGTNVEIATTIARPIDEVFAFWSDLKNLPTVMRHLESVTTEGDGRSHWKAKSPVGTTIEWDAETLNERPNELIAWQSLPGSSVDSAGTVRFERAPADRGTIVRLSLKYDPPGGIVVAGVAEFLGIGLESQLRGDLHRLKQQLETCEVATTEGQAQGARS